MSKSSSASEDWDHQSILNEIPTSKKQQSIQTPETIANNTMPDTLVTSMNTLSTSSTHEGRSSEPLKIGLDSGEDSSCSSCDDCDSDDYFFGETEDDTSDSFDPHAIEYFHKPPHKADKIAINSHSNCTSSTSSSPLSHKESKAKSTTSLPSLLASSSTSYSSSRDLNGSQSSHNLPDSLNTSQSSSSKRARFKLKNKRKSKVSLHKSVSVIPIPSRCEYSSIVREKLWSSSAELCANAARNSVEFAAEGWNWRNVIEDEDMLRHQASGELIHPIHVHNALIPQPGADDNLTLSLLAGLVPNKKQPQVKNTEVVIGVPTRIQEQINSDPIAVSGKM